MASARPDATAPASAPAGRPPRPPAYRDPLMLFGWLVALVALLAYWQLFVRKAPPRRGEEVARLTAVAGQVRLRVVTQDAWVEARVAERLRVGDVVQTEAASGAEIAFDAGNVVRVRPNSVVHIGGSAESSTAGWHVQAGQASFTSGAQRSEIHTPSLRASAAQDSSGDVLVDSTGATGLRLFQGAMAIETLARQRLALQANEAVRVDASGRAGEKLPLPPPPDLVAPPAKAEIPAGEAARLVWSAVPAGAGYRLAVDYNVMQAELLLAATLDAPGLKETFHELRSLGNGRYFWRVAAVSDAGVEGAFSRPWMFQVVPRPVASAGPRPPAAPALALEPLAAVAPGIFHLSGRTTPGAELTLNGMPVRVLPDGSFSEHVLQGTGRELLVRSSDAAGRTSERRLRVPPPLGPPGR